jgi:large repetitive protein
MKQALRILLALGLLPVAAYSQSPVVCPINAGADQTICAPNCATLTGTFVPTNQTTSYTASSITYAPDPYNVGTSLSLADDQWSGTIALPFTFCFYGTAYNSVVIGSNGLISFNVGAYSGGYCQWPISAAVPSTSDPVNAIMGPWQDLYPPAGGQIRYITYGTAPCRRFVVSWYQVPMYSCTSTLCTQQIVLYETTNIIDNFIQTKPLCSGWNGGKAIQAIQNQAGSNAVVQAGRNSPTQWTCTNDGRRWTPSGANTYQIAWYQGATLLGNTATVSVCPTNTTTYTFQATYTNCNNTTVTVSDQVIVNVNQLTTTVGPNQSICAGGCANISITAAGATAYQWTTIPGNTVVGNTQNLTVCPTVTTTYVGTATGPSCSGSDTLVITVAAMTTASAGVDDSICSGSCTTLQGSGGVSYSWAPAGSLSNPNIANPQACPTTTTQYTVTVTDANGCVGKDSVMVFVAPTVLSANVTPTNVTCFGACDGQATVNPAGGFTPYTYAWSNASTSQTATGLCAQTYNVTVTDDIGCTVTVTTSITEPTAVAIQATSITTANCGQNDGSVTISISGGTPLPGNVYTILWPASGNSGLTENNLAPGQVCVYVYDANGCGDTLCVTVPNTPGAGVTITSVQDVLCFNACDGFAVATGNGGTAPYTFVWNTMPQNQMNDTASALCPGNYIVTLTDSNGCTATASVTITQPPQVTVTPGPGQTICIGQSANLTANGNGGTPGYTYSWDDGNTIYSTQNITVSPTVTTVYVVTVTDANGCVSATQSVTVTVNPPLTVQAMNGITICAGDQVNLTANGNGGDGNLTYTWLPGPLVGQNQTVIVNTTTTYTVIVSDGCNTPPDSSTVTITVNPAPVVTFTANITEGCETLCVTFTNNTPNTASIVWMFGNNLGTSSAASPTFCFTNDGSYDVSAIVTDNIGCVAGTTMPGYITVWPVPNADFTANPQPATMLNNVVTFTDISSGGPVSWIWSFGDDDSASVIQNSTYAFPDSGTYNVQLIITNQYGCQDSVDHEIIVLEDYAYYIPNAFTPNGDGHNDVFLPMGMGVNPDKFTMYIFDRWGNLLFTTNDFTVGWDGKYSGNLCEVDTYVYKILTTSPDGSRHSYIGGVSLIR